MSCNCHGKSGISIKFISPYDQCTNCAKKHIIKAWQLFNEFNYLEDNRDTITGQLRLAVDHLMFEHQEIALQARELAILLEENRDIELTNEWQNLLSAIRNAFYKEHPQILQRLTKLQEK